jgi:hypothetical protein
MFDWLNQCKIEFEEQKSLPLGIDKGSGTLLFLRFTFQLGASWRALLNVKINMRPLRGKLKMVLLCRLQGKCYWETCWLQRLAETCRDLQRLVETCRDL